VRAILVSADRRTDENCSKIGTKHKINNDRCLPYAGMRSVSFDKVGKKRQVCLHRYRDDDCLDAGPPVTINLGGGQSCPLSYRAFALTMIQLLLFGLSVSRLKVTGEHMLSLW
jgi:hypothetical protein